MIALDCTAAWVPLHPQRADLAGAAEVAIRHCLVQAESRSLRPLVVATQKRDVNGVPALRQFVDRFHLTTPRGTLHATGPWSVLAWIPDFKSLGLAVRRARGGALVAVEWPGTRLIGWALAVGAVDLTTGEVTPDSRSSEVRRDLETLATVGNNDWGDVAGARDARRLLQRMRDRHELDRDVVLGYMLAHGHDQRSLERLGSMIDRLS